MCRLLPAQVSRGEGTQGGIRLVNKAVVIIHHRIIVDACLADEIEELNNKHGIVTEFCCCGHGFKRSAFISVKELSRDKMLALGYESVKSPQDNVFRPKSKCKCKTTRKCTKCGKVRRGWDRTPFKCYDCDFIEIRCDEKELREG